MRVYIVSRGYPSEKYVMNGIFEFDQAKALAKAGHEVIFLAVDLRSLRRIRRFGYESFQKDGVQIECINVPCGRIPEPVLLGIGTLALKALYKRCCSRFGKPDVIHAHFMDMAYITAEALSDEGIRMVMTEHLSKLNAEVISPKLITLGKKTYPRFDTVITVGTALQASLKKNFQADAVVIPNVVDLDSFTAGGTAPVKEESFRIVSVGSLIPRKKMDLLIRAFVTFHEKVPHAELVIFGGGEMKQTLAELIGECGLNSCVRLAGPRSRREICREMDGAACFALASDTETFGVVYIEAMAAGLPVIATRSNGPEDFVDRENGILVEPGQLEALTGAMEEIYRRYADYDRMQIRQKVLDRFSPEVIARQLIEIYMKES